MSRRWHVTKDELEFVTWLSRVNQDLGRYIVRLIDEANPLCTTDYTTDLNQVETELAQALTETARAVGSRAQTLPRQGRRPTERALAAAPATVDHPSEQSDRRVTR